MHIVEPRALEARSDAVSPARVLVASLGFAAALAVAAQLRVPLPFTPVPITLQTFVLYVGAAWLGPRIAGSGLVLYVGGALVGLPLLSGFRGGLAAFTGATGGYLVGWFLAALLLGRVLDGRRRGWTTTVVAMVGASAVVLFCGALHLALLLELSPLQAFLMGVAPFLPGDALKTITAAALVRRWPDPVSLR